MKIAVNTRLLIENKLDGIGWFTYETLKRITKSHPEHEFFFLFDRKYSDKFIFSDNVTPIVINPPARHPVLWYFWFEFSVKKILKKIKADLFISPDGYLSLSSTVRQISVIHDINFVHRPQDLPFLTRKYYNYFFPKFAKKAYKIATVSEYSKQDIIRQYNIPNNKIKVVYNGCNEMYAPVSEDIKQKTKQKYSDGKNYFIFIGTLHPRKNIARLFKAFEKFKSETDSDFKLVIVGTKMFMTKDIEQAFADSNFKNDIIFTGRLSPEELHNVLASAFAMTFVSLFEGFGIPLIEAMNCNVPIISSNTTSLPEVAGSSAIFVNPFKVDEIKDAMKKITENEDLRNNLVDKGRKRKEVFSWDKAAEKLWEVIIESTKSK
ncbi:MAG: glycosyltransferase family 4 protein [Bacteroidales bacterium]|nr:glycosyltransferase family 4 protein [Bacteroidales bacterium]